jgi:hypothetical protein
MREPDTSLLQEEMQRLLDVPVDLDTVKSLDGDIGLVGEHGVIWLDLSNNVLVGWVGNADYDQQYLIEIPVQRCAFFRRHQ